MARRIIIHIGLPKAASSSLQWALYERRAGLAGQGFRYDPDPPGAGVPKNGRWIGALLRNEPEPVRAGLEAARNDTLIVSSEGFTNHLYDFPEAALSAWRRLVSDLSPSGFLVTRDRSAWLPSYYAQCMFNPRSPYEAVWGSGTTFAEIEDDPKCRALLDTDRIARDARRYLGLDELHVCDVSDRPVAAFCQAFSCDLMTGSDRRVDNRQPPGWAVELMRQLNAKLADDGARLAWKAALGVYTGSTHGELASAMARLRRGQAGALDPALLRTVEPMTNGPFRLDRDDIDGFAAFRDRFAAADGAA